MGKHRATIKDNVLYGITLLFALIVAIVAILGIINY